MHGMQAKGVVAPTSALYFPASQAMQSDCLRGSSAIKEFSSLTRGAVDGQLSAYCGAVLSFGSKICSLLMSWHRE